MKTKMSAYEKVENQKGIFFKIGLISALSLCLFAFEYKTDNNVIELDAGIIIEPIDIDEIPITQQKEPEKPLPKIPTTQFEIVDDKTEIKEEIDFQTELGEIKELVLIETVAFIEERKEEPAFETWAEKLPEFPGGRKAMSDFISTNIKYPELAKRVDISGTVYITFIVEADGSLSNIVLERGIGGGCDEEALRVVGMMPPWMPAEQGFKKVRFRLTIPISFKFI